LPHLSTDILIVGAGGAGMYAAVAAAREGARVLLVDKSLVGRGGATIMAQMTVASAVGEQEPDHWTDHLNDTLAAGRGLCDESLAAVLCEESPLRIREMDAWKVGWAREGGHIKQVMAPGHNVARCVYVDFLNTGPAVAKTLRGRVARTDGITRISGLAITDLVTRGGAVVGAVGLNLEGSEPVTIAAKATILATGGLTRIYARNSASANMGGDAFGLALRAGAALIDMEFVQFFPIGHLAPRLVGMDPIMWDPFRYKLGGRLLNGNSEEFIEKYGATDSGVYTAARDIASYAIVKEIEAGRGSPAGGVYLSFEHIPESELRAAFGPVIDKLRDNGIDLTKRAVEVSPIAHYHMGGIRVTPCMETTMPGLYAAGEAVGGANGANRLSGNAIPEAFVFGERAGRFAAEAVKNAPSNWDDTAAQESLDDIQRIRAAADSAPAAPGAALGELFDELQTLMWDQVGLLRTGGKLEGALERLRDMQAVDLPALAAPGGASYGLGAQEWFDLRNSLLAAEAVTRAAIARTESRGAQQREDFPETDEAQTHNLTVTLRDGALAVHPTPVVRAAESVQ
jgi:succinate dehydrogenase/fumarate reductase flavoprotein subunit